MIRVWGRGNSINVQKVMWMLAEVGQPHERVDLGMAFGSPKEPWFLEINPNGLIPAIDDEGFRLWESNAIVSYLAQRYAAGVFWPEDVRRQALARQWMDWMALTVIPPLIAAFFQLIRTEKSARAPEVIADAQSKLSELFSLLDQALRGKDYVLGEEMTAADVPVGTAVYRWLNLDLQRPSLPALAAWYDRLCARPAFVTHVMLPLT